MPADDDQHALAATTRLAARLLGLARAQGLSLAVAESLTGGLLAAAVVSVPGASTVMRGGVVAYATDLKHKVLGVSAGDLARTGPVDAAVALQMAAGVARLLDADLALATTGVAGPGPAAGHPAGTVHVAAWTRAQKLSQELRLGGDRQQVRQATVEAALALGTSLLEAGRKQSTC